jgi:hypothetical protein
VKQFVDFLPVFFRNAAGFGFGIANFHRFGAQSPVLDKSFFRQIVNCRSRFG